MIVFNPPNSPDQLLDAVAANTVSRKRNIASSEEYIVTVSTANNANGTIRVRVSADPDVNFDNAASPSNEWSYASLYNNDDSSSLIVGSTGYSYTGTDEVVRLIVNAAGLRALAVEVSGYAAGNFTATYSGTINQSPA